MVKKNLQVNCSGTLAILLIVSLFASSIVFAEEELTAEELLAQCKDKYAQADSLWFSKKYDKAKTLYQYVAQNSSDSDLTMNSKARGASCDIQLGNVSGAGQAIEALKKDYPTHDGLCPELSRLCDDYWNMQQYDKAKALCQYIFQNSLDSNLAFEARIWLAGCENKLGNDSAIDQAFEAILVEYSAAGSFLDADRLSMFAECYQVCDFYERSVELYQQMLNSASDKNQQFHAHVGIGKSSALLGNDTKVKDTLGILRADFAEHEKLGWAIFIIGEEYFYKAFPNSYKTPNEEERKELDKCLSIWKGIIDNPCDNHYTMYAYYYSAIVYQELKDYQKSTACYQGVFSEFPDSKHAAHALFMTGRNYEKLHRTRGNSTTTMVLENIIDPNEVVATVALDQGVELTDPNSVTASIEASITPVNSTRAAYELLVEEYPDSPGAAYARHWLSTQNSR